MDAMKDLGNKDVYEGNLEVRTPTKETWRYPEESTLLYVLSSVLCLPLAIEIKSFQFFRALKKRFLFD